jgi:asparagine synthase (glutamine-hydrolysing)
MIHRGPDSEGIHIGESIGMGMRRLRIIDLAGGDQPIANETNTVWVVLNGEIYNFRELRKVLEGKGHRFRTNSDTEVIVHAYEEYGLQCVKYLRGMFSFSLWDAEHKRLFIARDRLGQKPLYYHERNGSFWFCSELQCMLQDPEVQRSVNPLAVDYYFTFQYIPSPLTIYEGIHKLLPGHTIVVENGKIDIAPYWKLDNRPVAGSEEEHMEKVRELAQEAVKLRLISDVPLGAFLSGGIDSSIIVGLMTKVSNAQVKTFSIGFEEEEFNELPYARIVAEKFETDHHEFIVKADVAELIPKLVQNFGEPFGDSSAIPTYYVSKMARSEVTVALSGDAGDELFAGYSKYPYLERREVYSISRKRVNGFLYGLLRRLEPSFIQREHILRRVHHSLLGRVSPVEERDYMWMTYLDSYDKSKLYRDGIKSSLPDDGSLQYYRSELRKSPNTGAIDRIMFADMKNYLPDDLNTKVDITSMACSLEVRSPFMDHKFVEFAASVPKEYKIRNGNCKYLLKNAFSDIVPKIILERRKMGFAIPVDKWFRTDLKPLFEAAVLGSTSNWMREQFDMTFITRLYETHQSQKYNHGSKLWLILNFFLWHDAFMGD